MVMPFDAGFSDYNAERLRAADTLLLGRTLYEGFRSYWPAVAEDMSQPAVERRCMYRRLAPAEESARTFFFWPKRLSAAPATRRLVLKPARTR